MGNIHLFGLCYLTLLPDTFKAIVIHNAGRYKMSGPQMSSVLYEIDKILNITVPRLPSQVEMKHHKESLVRGKKGTLKGRNELRS